MKELKLTPDYAVYPPKKQSIYPIQENDWERIKRMIRSIVPQRRLFQIMSSVFFGIFASSILTLIGFLTVKEIASWAIPTTLAILCSSLVLGIVLQLLDISQKRVIEGSTKSVLEEMTLIEQHFEISPTAIESNTSPTTKTSFSFELVEAIYGIPGHQIDVTKTLKEFVVGDRLLAKVSNKLAPVDPAPNQIKTLGIKYEHHGTPFFKEFKEQETVDLP